MAEEIKITKKLPNGQLFCGMFARWRAPVSFGGEGRRLRVGSQDPG